MKTIISMLFAIQVVHAAPKKLHEVKEGLEESTKVIEQVLDQDIGKDNTCLDEYLNREKELRNWLIWTPPLAIAATPAAAVAGGFIGGGFAKALAIGGWDALGYAIGGGMIGFGAGIVAFVSIEVVSGVRFYYNRQLIHLITESNANHLKGENLFSLQPDRSWGERSNISRSLRSLEMTRSFGGRRSSAKIHSLISHCEGEQLSPHPPNHS